MLYAMSKVDPADTKTEIACSIARTILQYVEDKYDRHVLERLIYRTRMNLPYLENRSNWVSLSYLHRLLDELVELTGNVRAPFEAGTYGGKRQCFGPLEALCARLGSMASFYRLAFRFSPRWNKVADVRLLSMGTGSCRVSFSYPGHSQTRANCLCIQGALASGAEIRGLPRADVRQLECACDGADACVYEITWKEPPKRLWGAVGFIMGLAVGAVGGWIIGWGAPLYALTLLCCGFGYYAGRNIDYKVKLRDVYRRHDETADSLHESVEATERLNVDLQSKVEVRTRELQEAVTDLQESRERELAAERQAAVGVLAAGMAHELNSPLNAIRLCLQGLEEDLPDTGPIARQLDIANRATNRCKRIVNDLLSFAREPRRETVVRIDQILERAVSVFRREASEDIRIVKHVAPDLPALRLDRMQIQQVILNLLKNATDAMSNKGRIDVELLHEDRHTVVLRVRDRGPGIADEHRGRVFDPFFTTKSGSQGMGLGLSISYQLVARNGGTIRADNAGGGAVFTVRFPTEACNAAEQDGRKGDLE